MLVLEIEYLGGVCYAARDQVSSEPDWPPQPDRVYSALVATWGMQGEDDRFRPALTWLEQQAVEGVYASDYNARQIGNAYVPVNDALTLAERRSRQPRQFPAALPDDPLVEIIWTEEPEQEILDLLDDLARDTASVGHSASLTRCRFRRGESVRPNLRQAPQRRIGAGRLATLEASYHAGRRPPPGDIVIDHPANDATSAGTTKFGRNWLVLELHANSFVPSITAFPLYAKAMRDTLLAGFDAIGMTVPEVISGHQPDGSPTAKPHMAVLPLADLGWQHARGTLMGFGLALPPAFDNPHDNPDTFQLLQGVMAALNAKAVNQYGTRLLQLCPRGDDAKRFMIELHLASVTGRQSLKPSRYSRPSRYWATATPIVLDRHLKQPPGDARQQEIEAIIVQACRNIGLPEPASITEGSSAGRPAIQLGKHSGISGATPAHPSVTGTRPRWRLPPALRSREMCHAVIRFAQPVSGPVILGAGRFHGMGLCLPFTPQPRSKTRS